MKAFTEPLKSLGQFDDMVSALRKKGIFDIDGCVDSEKANIESALSPCGLNLIVAADDTKARELLEDWKLYDRKAMYYPAKDIIFYQADLNGNLITTERMCVLKELISNGKNSGGLNIITTFDAFMEKLPGLGIIKDNIVTLNKADSIDLEDFTGSLIRSGYEKTAEVEAAGQFAVRGGIIDIFPLTDENPVRIELWGDDIDSVRAFDIVSQRSIE